MEETKGILKEMGFDDFLIDKAIESNGPSVSIEAAVQWIEVNQEKLAEGDTNEQKDSIDDSQAKSIRCDECGKHFKNQDHAEFHAAKSGHSNFSMSTDEVKPMSEEEKSEKLKELQEKLALKREKQRLLDLEAKKQNEQIRRKAGKEMTEFKEKQALKDMEKLAEEKKKEKNEDKLQRERIKAQIEADRLERKRKPTESSSSKSKVDLSGFASSKTLSDTVRIQVRFMDGVAPLTISLNKNSLLQEIFEAVQVHRTKNGKLPNVDYKLSTA
ncbi:hypothetical protein ROZALSC1DRAFT_31928, partial [Rozella allomycis CSF55]